jgi:osmotically-inducible protein OsmY
LCVTKTGKGVKMKFNGRFQLISAIVIASFLLSLVALSYAANDQSSLKDRVLNKIGNYYEGNNFDISTPGNGRIVIKGDVNTLYDKLRIYDLISQVPGVREIEDDLDVNTPMIPDDVIKQNIESELKLVHSILEPNRIKVTAHDGEVILSGDVSYFREKEMAETVASWEQGVTAISNQIQVLPSQQAVSDANIKTVLQEIMKNRFPMNDKVSFTVNDGVVTLTGQAFSLWDKHQIDKQFSHVLGVKKVVNNLTTVSPEAF